MNRAGTVAFGALAAVLVAAAIALVIEVRRGPEPAVAPAGSGEPPAATPAGSDRAPAPRPQIGPGAGLMRPGHLGPPGRPSLGGGLSRPEELEGARVARAERDKVLAGLRDSGSGTESWDGDATRLLGGVGAKAESADQVGCYVAGCGGSFTFASEADFDRDRTEIEALPEFQAWTGGKRWTTPETQPDGTVIVALALYRPD